MTLVNINITHTINLDAVVDIIDSNPRDPSSVKIINSMKTTAMNNGKYIDATNSYGIKCIILFTNDTVMGLSLRKEKLIKNMSAGLVKIGRASTKQQKQE